MQINCISVSVSVSDELLCGASECKMSSRTTKILSMAVPTKSLPVKVTKVRKFNINSFCNAPLSPPEKSMAPLHKKKINVIQDLVIVCPRYMEKAKLNIESEKKIDVELDSIVSEMEQVGISNEEMDKSITKLYNGTPKKKINVELDNIVAEKELEGMGNEEMNKSITQLYNESPLRSDYNEEQWNFSPFCDSVADPTFIPSESDSDLEETLKNKKKYKCVYDFDDASSSEKEDNIFVTERVDVLTTPNKNKYKSLNKKLRKHEPLELQECNDYKNADVNSDENMPSASCFGKDENLMLSSKPHVKKKVKIVRKPDFCFYCETEVLNFGRHIIRHHSLELEVQKILSFPPNSQKRKSLFAVIRKRGNFLKNSNELYKPVRESYIPNQLYFSCDICLGMYSKKLLYRHKKRCTANASSINSEVLGSNLLLGANIDKKLKQEVFPRMRADKISLEAKKDSLICTFGARYLKTHREKHFINVVSRKMRELSRLLLEIKKLEPNIHTMLDVLQPQYFDLIVQATKNLARFDILTETFEAPTYAMNIATSLKQCCDIAITLAITKKDQYMSVSSAEKRADLKAMIHLLTVNWNFEISNIAGNNLNINKWNKVTIVPLASDLKLLKNYLVTEANEAIKRLLENNSDVKAFTTLTEIIFCRIILLNRRRPGELQRMYLNTYTKYKDSSNYEEFQEAVSSAEKILLKNLKRVVIRGKRGRGVPVLFSLDIQEHINIMLKHRTKFIEADNPYFFGKPNTKTPIIGYKVLEKYVKACGAQNVAALTSTRLRKHLATLTQVFNLSDNEIEQLANFMGHTQGVHKSSYRLPNDVYQTAKLSKLLILMEEGRAGEFKGKSLDDIELDMEENILDETHEKNINVDEIPVEDYLDIEDKKYTTEVTEKKPILNTKKTRTLVPWTDAQKKVVKEFFKKHILKKKPPKRFECEELIEKHSTLLKNKSWLKIKVFIQNEYRKK